MIHGLILIRNTVQPLLTAVCYLSMMATSLQWPLSLEDSPYTDSRLNLSTKAIFFYPHGGHCREFQLYSFDLQYLAFSGYPKCLPNLVNSSWLWRTGHFWVPPGLCIKTRLSAQANKTHFHKKVCALGLIVKVRVFGIQKWLISHFIWANQRRGNILTE